MFLMVNCAVVITYSQELCQFGILFTRDDQTNIPDPREEPFVKKVQETQNINIGTSDSPKYINLGTSCTTEEIDQYTHIFKEFQDIFSWSYDDLK
jgi:hypothetical protein